MGRGDRGGVDVFYAVPEPGRRQHQSRGRIGIRRDDVRARLNKIAVYAFEHVNIFQRRQAAPGVRIHRDATSLQFGSRSSVENDHFAIAQPVLQRRVLDGSYSAIG